MLLKWKLFISYFEVGQYRGTPRGGRDCQVAIPPHPKNQNFKNMDFLDMMISTVFMVFFHPNILIQCLN
jgi:hypothetical protein